MVFDFNHSLLGFIGFRWFFFVVVWIYCVKFCSFYKLQTICKAAKPPRRLLCCSMNICQGSFEFRQLTMGHHVLHRLCHAAVTASDDDSFVWVMLPENCWWWSQSWGTFFLSIRCCGISPRISRSRGLLFSMVCQTAHAPQCRVTVRLAAQVHRLELEESTRIPELVFF